MKEQPKLQLPTKYEIGYAKPPASTRFKPGQSGNPHGRPKGKKVSQLPQREEYLKSIILDEAYRKIKVVDGNKKITVTMAQAAIRSLAVSAGKGSIRAQRIFADLVWKTEAARKAHYDEWLEQAIEYKVSWETELERRKVTGSTEPDPIPHPDDMIINFDLDIVEMRGPMSKEELEELERLLNLKEDHEQELSFLHKCLGEPGYKKLGKSVEYNIKYTTKILEVLNRSINRRAGPKCLARLAKRSDTFKTEKHSL